MRLSTNDISDVILATRLYTSREVKILLGIKSDTTLIKLERQGSIKIAARIGNQKRYSPKHITKLMNSSISLGV